MKKHLSFSKMSSSYLSNCLSDNEDQPELLANRPNHQAIIKRMTLPAIGLTNKDKFWLKHLKQTVAQNISNFYYNVQEMAADMSLSRQHLTRRLRELTGLTAQQYLQEERLKAAKTFLESNNEMTTVKAVALEIGYKDIKYFSRLFKQRFGQLPSNCLFPNLGS